ncbi:SRPBCC family protein [Candidatus Gracilibacteria bacterium 28_42_T64]|nr:SRPBCC family protein [Candidatus Gracilibacteria bacterium 28_42_T64]
MKVSIKVLINSPIGDVWKVLADDFDKAGDWMSPVPKSHKIQEGKSASGSPMVGRICEFTSKGAQGLLANEKITFYDGDKHLMTVEIVPKNGPGLLPIVKNTLDISAISVGDDQTEVIWTANPQLKPHGYVLYPLLILGFKKGFGDILEELKYFVETGKPHPRKLKKINS